MGTLIIRAQKNENGKYVMIGDNGDMPQEGLEHDNKQSVYDDCHRMYNGQTWQGKKMHSGYSIVVD